MGFGKLHQLFTVGLYGPSASPTSLEVCGGAGRVCESQVGPISFGWSQIDDRHTYGRVTVAVGGSCSGSCEHGGGRQFFATSLLG